MRSPLTRRFSLLALALMLLLTVAGVTPATSLAQDPPPAAEEATPTPTGEQPTPQPGAPLPAVRVDDSAEAAPAPQSELPESSADAAPEQPEQGVALPDGYAPPAELAELSGAELAELNFPSLIQGDIKLDLVINPERVPAGEDLTYTYIFTNTRSTSASNFIIRARWTQFRRATAGGIYQFCKEVDCPPTSIGGTVVQRSSASDTEIVYTVTSTLAPGQSGRFAVVLSTRNDNYPQTGKPPRRPSGSAQLANSTASPVISEDTASSLFVGPVFALTKQPADASKFVNVGDVAEFTITVGNATATADVIDGVIRADATPATNIELVDNFPQGSEFVSAEGPVQPTVDTTAKQLRWSIPGPLNPGQSIPIKVRFRKLDVSQQCGLIENGTYNVTSAEVPIKTAPSTRYTIPGPKSSVTVRTPLVVQSIKAGPASPIFGSTAKLTITVQSYWPQPISNLEVRYSVQSNAFYVPGGATPAPVTQPNGSTLGGDVIWRINMPAGNVTTPSSQVLVLTVRGNESGGTVASGTGRAQIIAPVGVPSACMKTLDGRVNFQPRLDVSKFAGTDAGGSGPYVVERLDSFPYVIRITNRSSTAATNLIVDDLLPDELGANLSYIPGSATLGSQPFEPSEVLNGHGGIITWRNVSVGANSTVEIRYRLTVDGQEFIDYCNDVRVGPEAVRKVNPTRACVRVNPKLDLTKTADRDTIDGNLGDNGEVTFTLSMVNLDDFPFDIALYDVGDHFEYVRMEDGGPEPTEVGTRNYEWPRITLGPGQTTQLRFVARLLPDRCANAVYYNELRFRWWPANGGASYTVRTIPATRVGVQYLCGSDSNLISYSKAVDATTISTRDKHLFTLNVRNENPKDGGSIANVEVVDVLPSGFTYAGMGASGNVRDLPQITTRPDGRVKLTWQVSTIPANTTIKVEFYARSGDIVGTFTNWIRASAPGAAGVKGCQDPATCRGYTVINDEGADRIYAVRDVKVEPMATIDPSIDRKDECALPNELRTYQIALVNTNRHDYGSTAITTTLPLGLHFEGVSGTTPAPTVERTERGTVLRWSNLTLPKKPSNAAYGQLSLQVRVRIGQVWGPLQPLVEASSPDGSLPKKDGVLDPTVNLCVEGPALSLDASKLRVAPDEQFYYVISAVNPGATPLTLSVDNTLDARLSYLSTVVGPAATQAGNKLTWSNLQVPAATDKGPGVLLIVYKVQPKGAQPGDIIPNKLSVAQSSVNLNTDIADVDVVIVDPITKFYLPMLRR